MAYPAKVFLQSLDRYSSFFMLLINGCLEIIDSSGVFNNSIIVGLLLLNKSKNLPISE